MVFDIFSTSIDFIADCIPATTPVIDFVTALVRMAVSSLLATASIREDILKQFRA